MSRLNNKGYMLVEIILASALAFGLAFFLLDLTVKLKNKNDDLLVRTLVSTDQAIVMNTIMKEIEEDFDNFTCDDIKFEENTTDGGYIFKFRNSDNEWETKSIITKYATVSYDYQNDCNKDVENQTAVVNVDIKVKQLPDEDFSSNIDYAEKYYGISCPKSNKGPNAPVLDDGMIPVSISNDGTVTTVSSSNNDNKWYDYDSQKWANAVLVKENGTKTRNYYQEYANAEVEQSDILAYFVWIPRYSYAFSDEKAAKDDTGAREICIQFEEKDDTKRTGTAVNRSYYTHPSFTFGTEDLSGIWVGKFETSEITTTECYEKSYDTSSTTEYDSAIGNKCDNNNHSEPRILPGVSSLRYLKLSNMFSTSLKFAGGTLASNGIVSFDGSSAYGLSKNVDSHMMKNSDWGAIMYLTHSMYGINKELAKNTNSTFTTGSGDSTSIEYGSGASLYSQSSTGNISGIFDLVGGANENVMSFVKDSSEKIYTAYEYNNGHLGSGFNGYYGSTPSIKYSEGIELPEEKYYDLYLKSSDSSKTHIAACDGKVCYGHALTEVMTIDTTGSLPIVENVWYNGKIQNLTYSWPCISRGSSYFSDSLTGMFGFTVDTCYNHRNYGFRTVLATG